MAEKLLALSYASARVFRRGRFARLLRRTPQWVIALILVLPPAAWECFGTTGKYKWLPTGVIHDLAGFAILAAMFLPGALREFRPRAAAGLLALAGVIYGFQQVFPHQLQFAPYPLFYFWIPGAMVLLAGLMQWWLLSPRAKMSLIAILAAAGAASLLLAVFWWGCYCWAGGRLILAPQRRFQYWGDIVFMPVLVMIAWMLIPVALRLGESRSRLRWAAGSGSLLLVVATCQMFFILVGSPELLMMRQAARECKNQVDNSHYYWPDAKIFRLLCKLKGYEQATLILGVTRKSRVKPALPDVLALDGDQHNVMLSLKDSDNQRDASSDDDYTVSILIHICCAANRLADATALAQRIRGPDKLSIVLNEIAAVQYRSGAPQVAETTWKRALAIATRIEDEFVRVNSMCAIADAQHACGDAISFQATSDRIADAINELHDPRAKSHMLVKLAVQRSGQGRRVQASLLFKRAADASLQMTGPCADANLRESLADVAIGQARAGAYGDALSTVRSIPSSLDDDYEPVARALRGVGLEELRIGRDDLAIRTISLLKPGDHRDELITALVQSLVKRDRIDKALETALLPYDATRRDRAVLIVATADAERGRAVDAGRIAAMASFPCVSRPIRELRSFNYQDPECWFPDFTYGNGKLVFIADGADSELLAVAAMKLFVALNEPQKDFVADFQSAAGPTLCSIAYTQASGGQIKEAMQWAMRLPKPEQRAQAISGVLMARFGMVPDPPK